MNIMKCQHYQQFYETLDYIANVTLPPECKVSAEKIRLFLFNNQCFYQSDKGIYTNALLRQRLCLLEVRASREWTGSNPVNQELEQLIIENRGKRSQPSLPIELWNLVYDCLSKKDKIKFSSVCKEFKLLVIERINKNEMSLDDYAEWYRLARLKNVQTIVPYSLIYDHEKLARVMHVWGRYLTRLETFLFDEEDKNYLAIFHSCLHLKWVRIKEGGSIKVQGFEALLKVPNLQRLHIEGENYFGTILPEVDLNPQRFQRSLTSLNLAGISNLYFSTYEGFPPSLQSLLLSCLNHRIPIWRQALDCKVLPKSLRRLDLSDWNKLKTIQNLDYLENLEELILRDCLSLKELDGVGRLQKLQSLNISNCIEILTQLFRKSSIFKDSYYSRQLGFKRDSFAKKIAPKFELPCAVQ